MAAILFLSFAIFCLLFFVGFGFTYIFIPKRLRADAIWLSPWFGVILISVLGVILSLGRIPMYKAAYVILSTALLLLFYALITKKLDLQFSKESWIIVVLTIICFLFNIFPLLVRAGFPTTISLGNLDPLSYTPVGDFLVNHTVFEGFTFEHYKPFLWATGDLLHAGFRWGSPMVLSFFSAIFNVRSYQVYSILINIFFTLSFPLVYVLTKNLMKVKSKYIPILIFITFAINSTLLYMLYNVFFAQFIFSGIYILLAILFLSYTAESGNKKILLNSYDFLIAVGVSSITTVYPEGLLFVLTPFLIYTLIKLVLIRDTTWLVRLIKIFALVLVINPITFGTSIKMNVNVIFSSAKSGLIGWDYIPYAMPFEIMGFYNLYYSRVIPVLLDILIALPIVFVWIIGFLKSKHKEVVLSYLLTFIPFYIGLRFIFPNFFSYHRAVTYSVFIYSVLFSIGAVYLLSLLKKKVVIYAVLLAFFALSLRSAHRTIYQLYWHPRIVDKSLTSLQQLNQDEKMSEAFYTADVYLGEYDLWKRLWREYFLMNKLIVTRQNYSVERNNLKDIRLVLAEKDYLGTGKSKLRFTKIVWQNKYYQLGLIEPLPVAEDLQVKLKE